MKKDEVTTQTERLAERLLATAPKDWKTEIMVALHSVFEDGYRVGFQSGKSAPVAPEPVQVPDNDTGLEETGLAAIAGEDRALERTTQTEDEQLEDIGHEVFRGILRQLGEAKRRGYEVALGVPDDVNLRYVFKDGEKPVDIVMTETKGT